MLIGLISDTHIPESRPDLWPQVYQRFQGVDLILHAGDLHRLSVVDRLEQIAPIYVSRGNGEDGSGGRQLVPEDPRLRSAWTIELEGVKVGLTHDLPLPEMPPRRTLETMMQQCFGEVQDVVVFGHSHVALVEVVRGVTLINPGSPTYPLNLETRLGTIGFLEIAQGSVRAWLEQLDEHGTHIVSEQPRYF